MEDDNAVQDQGRVRDQCDPMLVVEAQPLDNLVAETEPRRMESVIDTHVVEVLGWGIGTAVEVGVDTIVVGLLRLHDVTHAETADLDELEQLELRSRNSHKGSTCWARVVEGDLHCTRAQLVVDQSHSDLVTAPLSVHADQNMREA